MDDKLQQHLGSPSKSQTSSAVTAALIEGVSVPGVAAADAVDDFEAEVAPWLEADGSPPAKHMMAGLVIEGFKRASAAVSEDAKALVHCCVLRSGDIQVMLAEIEQTGEYDMEASESEERVGQLPGFRDFDPATAGGSENWDLVKKVLVAYGSKSVNAAVDEQVAKELWEQVEIESVREFTALERKAFRNWKRAGGSISDSTRIQDIKSRFSDQMLAAYKAYILSEDTHGRHDHLLEKQWSRFKAVFRRVGQAVERSGGSISTAGDAVVQPAPARRNVFPVVAARGAASEAAGHSPEQLRLMNIKNTCFEHSKLGNNSYGDRCRFNHDGEPGALRHLIVNEAGECVQFNRFGNCRRQERGKCTFIHNPKSVQPAATAQPGRAQNSTAVMTTEQHRQIMSYANAAGKDPSTVTVEEAQTAPARRNVFTVLHQERAERGRRRPAINSIQWEKWTKANDESEEEEDYCDQ